MPIINGQKMACAPCIRGHRSTKCNHYLERVMVPVRKPGRPLSTCPCPPGRPCACGGVRIAIPKKQRCLCPSVPLHEPDGFEQESSPTETPTSPTRPAFRIGKPSGAGKASSRKQSFDPASLERMDPRSINLIASPNGSNGLNGITNGVNGVSMTSPGEAPTGMVGYVPPMAMMPAGPTSSFAHPPPPNYGATMAYSMGPLQYPVRPQMSPNIKTENGGYTPPLNGNYGVAMTTPYVNGSQLDGFSSFSSPPQPSILGPSPISKANGSVSAGGSCCGSKAQAPTPITTPAPTPAATSQPTTSTPQQGDGTQTGGGNCCSGKRSAQAPQLDMNNMPPPQPALSAPQQGNAASSGGGGCCGSKPQIPHLDLNNMSPPQQGYGQPFASQFSPVDMKIGDMNVFHFPTVFTYPAGFGSWQQPINPTIWQEVASRPAMQLENPISPTTNGGISGGDTIGNSHECSCGEGCQCVGCLAHPFNEQMFQYVNNAYSSNSSSANGSANGGSPNAGPALGGTSAELAAAGTAGGHQTLGGRPETPPQAPTPNNESSPASEEESLSSFDYFFVNLPISGLCEGNIALCPCGDDCNCVGCLVHNTSGM